MFQPLSSHWQIWNNKFHCNCRSTSPASITDMVLDDKAAPAPSSSPASPRKLRLPFTSFPSSNSFSLAKAPSITIRQRSPSPGQQTRPALLGGRSCSFLASNARIEQVRAAAGQRTQDYYQQSSSRTPTVAAQSLCSAGGLTLLYHHLITEKIVQRKNLRLDMT